MRVWTGTGHNGEGNGTMELDFGDAVNRMMAGPVIFKAVRDGLITEAEGWAQWDKVSRERLAATRTPEARSAHFRNKAITARRRADAVRAEIAAANARQAEAIRIENARTLAYNALAAAEEAADRQRRAEIARTRREEAYAALVAREEAAMSDADRRAVRMEIDQDTSAEVGQLMFSF